MSERETEVQFVNRRKRGRARQTGPRLVDQAGYDPARLLGVLMARLVIKNDAALARALGVMPPVISKIRHHRLAVGPSLLIRMHELSGLSIRELRSLMQRDAQVSAPETPS